MCGQTHRGNLLDLSPGGLFVQTLAVPPIEPNVDVEVRLCLQDPPTILPVEATIVRHHKVPTNLAVVSGGGLGLKLRKVPEAWSRFLAALEQKMQAKAAPLVSRVAVGRATAAGCLGCRRSDRPLSSGLCAWCMV
jgi:hypothetical protein